MEHSQAKRETIDRIFTQYNEAVVPQTRELYTELTGDTNTTGFSINTMISEVNDETPREQLQRIVKTRSWERAGWVEPPTARLPCGDEPRSSNGCPGE